MISLCATLVEYTPVSIMNLCYLYVDAVGNNSSKSDAPEPPGCPFGTSACNSTACCALTFPPPPSPAAATATAAGAAAAADAQASTRKNFSVLRPTVFQYDK